MEQSKTDSARLLKQAVNLRLNNSHTLKLGLSPDSQSSKTSSSLLRAVSVVVHNATVYRLHAPFHAKKVQKWSSSSVPRPLRRCSFSNEGGLMKENGVGILFVISKTTLNVNL